jgi:hypothetical protein
VQLRDLLAAPFLREMHHFLWIEPTQVGGMTDPGWSCRDHAWLTALLARSLGHDPLLVHGEAFFVRGPAAGAASISGHQSPHNWVYLPDIGAIDLSTRCDWQLAGGDYTVPIDCIFANTWIPRRKGKAYFLHDPGQFSGAIEELSRQRNRYSAIYRVGEAEELHEGHVTRAAGWIRSPLAARLGAVYGDPTDLYCALLLHLRALLDGKAPSFAALPQAKAWEAIARARDGAAARASQYFNAPVHARPSQPAALAA